MKKIITSLVLSTFLLILLLTSASSVPNLEITKIDKGSVVISELNNPAIFEFIINNKGPLENFEIYSLVGVSMGPKGKFSLPNGETKLKVYAFPNEEIRSRAGYFNFEYQMKGEGSGIFKDNLLIKIVPLSEVLEVSAAPISPEDKKIRVFVKNKENTNLEDVKIKLASVFFSETRTVSLEPFETSYLEIKLDDLQTKNLTAGSYVISGEIEIQNKKTKVDSVIEYIEKEKLVAEESSEGYLIKTTKIKKTNQGNKPAKAVVEIKKDVVSRLFTVNNPEALGIRDGLSIIYIWEKDLAPGDSLTIQSKTNYIFPLVLLVLIVLAGLLAKSYSQNAIVVNKKVSFVKTKGGEFALKVVLHLKAKSFVTNAQLIDTLPAMAKLYEQFGKKPDKIDANTRRLTWNIGRVNSGEERVYSYIIYSKLKVVGRFELPAATAIFEKDGKIQEIWSNRAFFVADTALSKE